MAHEGNEILQRYIEKVLQLQREREQEQLSEEDLKQIALDSGMTDADLAYAEERFLEYLDRGEGFIRYNNWDGAISELEQALVLAPNDTTVLNALATAHWNRSKITGNPSDRAQAKFHAERCLNIDSRNDTALRLMSTMQKGDSPAAAPSATATQQVSPRAKKGILATVAASLILMVAGAVGAFMIGSDGTDVPAVTVPAEQPASQPPATSPAPAPAEAPETPPDAGFARLAQSFGSEGIGAGMFDDARSITVDGNGNIYVGEYSGGRIQVFDSAGKFITQWNIGEKKYLSGMAADRNGVVYVANSGKLHRYEGATGKLLGELRYAKGNGFTDVAAAPDGGVVAAWDGNWRGGIMINPQGKDDIIRFDRNGKSVKSIKSAISTATDAYEYGARVAVDGTGNIYALGTLNEAVFKFSPDGKFMNRFGGRAKGNEPGKLSSPDAIAVDGRGRVYVAAFHGVHVFDSEGTFIDVIEVKGPASGLAFNDKGELFVVARTKVLRYVIQR